MATLANFPMVNQNTTITEDGQPNKDAPFECVSTSLLAATMWLLGVSQVGGKYTPDYFKDQAYGEAYYGGTSAEKYVGLCASLGVRLWAFDGIPGALISEAHRRIQAGNPVVFTEPDPYVSASLGWTHVCVFYSEEQGFLTALDPYIGKPVRRTDDEWAKLLLDNQLWILEKEDDIKTIEITDPEVSRYFELANAEGTQWRCRSNGKIIQFGILDYYRAVGNAALCGLTYLGLPQSNEIPLVGTAGAVKQYFERGTLIYDPAHQNDNPPGAGAVYAAHLYIGPAQDPRVSQLQTALTQAQQASNLSGADSGAAAKLAQVRAIIG